MAEKDGITLMAEAIRKEIAEAEAKAKKTNAIANVADATAQFAHKTTEAPKAPVTPSTPAPQETPDTNDGTSEADDGTT